MRTWVAGLVGLAAVAGAAFAGSRIRTPTVYTVAGAGFTLPESGLKADDAESKSVAFGSKPGHAVLIESSTWVAAKVHYTLTVASLPEALKATPAEVLLKGAKKGLVEPAGQGVILKVEDKKPITLPNGPAECMALHIEAGTLRIRARIAAYDGRIYELTAVGRKGDIETAEVTAALDSFTVLGPPTP